MVPMLVALTKIMVWLCAGEILSRLNIIPVPGPVIGLVFLYCQITYEGSMSDELGSVADRLLQFLGMLFVPAGVGVVGHLDRMSAEALPIAAAIIGGTAMTIVATAFAADRIGAHAAARHTNPRAEAQDAAA